MSVSLHAQPAGAVPAGTEALAAATAAAADCLRAAKASGAGLVVLTGAGMSVMSGVPVFRHADGTMSAEFLAFLGAYNAARRAHGLAEADGWFQFSVAEMFRPETAKQAWAYWRWRILRAQVEPAEDYQSLGQLVSFFGEDKVFVRTSNCDMLHERAGLPASRCHEIHGSLGRLQCSDHCNSAELYPVDEPFLQRLRAEPDWVPACPCCKKACLRPNVMIFADSKLEHSHIQQQQAAFDAFTAQFEPAEPPQPRPPAATEAEAAAEEAFPAPTAAELAEIRKAFDKADTNQNGKLEPAEVQAAGLALGKYLLNIDIEQAFVAMDTDGDGCVDFDEFVGWWWREGKLSALEKLDRKWKQFGDRFDQLTTKILVAGGATKASVGRQRNLVVLEVGAGVVVPSIRSEAEHLAAAGCGLIRINPSTEECTEMQTSFKQKRYHPVVGRSDVALAAIAAELGLE